MQDCVHQQNDKTCESRKEEKEKKKPQESAPDSLTDAESGRALVAAEGAAARFRVRWSRKLQRARVRGKLVAERGPQHANASFGTGPIAPRRAKCRNTSCFIVMAIGKADNHMSGDHLRKAATPSPV